MRVLSGCTIPLRATTSIAIMAKSVARLQPQAVSLPRLFQGLIDTLFQPSGASYGTGDSRNTRPVQKLTPAHRPESVAEPYGGTTAE